MKYKSFKITNYKWIEDLEISFTEGNLLILSGLNKSEKTTVLDAINNWGLMTKKQYLENGKKNALLPKYKTLWTGTISIGAVLNIKGCKAELDCFEPKSDELEIIFGYSVENGQFTTNEPSCTFRIKGKAVDNNDNSLQQSSILEKTPDILYYDDFCYDVPKEIKFELATTDSTNELINKMWQSILSDAFLSFKKAKQEHKTEVTFESFIKNFSEEDKKDNASNTLSQLSTYISNQIREPWNKKSSFKEIRLEYSKIDNAIYFWFKVISENGSDFAVNERSKWFKWFFSFIMLTTFRMSRNSNTLFLLDEPASSLHASVQEEVTQLIIELTNECQVIYTTNKGIKLNVKDLFNYSTIAKLANKIVNKDNLYISTKTNLLLLQDIENNLARTDTKVTYDLKKNINNILLTGATGFLGQHILIDLLESTTVNIYCLIRANSDNKNVQKKLDQILICSGNIKYVNNPRVICIEGDLSKPNLGLSINTIIKLEKAIDIIYHCGAYVHHLHTYENLREANVLATIELVKLANTRKLKQLHYISTLGTISATEENIWKPSESLLSSVGYIQSKWVCEKILWSYIERNYPFYIYRPGNITGHTVSGFCIPKNNHLLLLLKGIIQIRVAPKWDMPFEMVPVNKVSKAIISLSLNKKQMSQNIFNLHNSQSITWKNYLQIINNITNLKMKFVNTEYFLINILPNIGTDNAMYPIKNFYESRSIDNIKLLSDQETQKYLRELSVTYPSQKEYIKLLNLYIEYLVKIGFLNIKKL